VTSIAGSNGNAINTISGSTTADRLRRAAGIEHGCRAHGCSAS